MIPHCGAGSWSSGSASITLFTTAEGTAHWLQGAERTSLFTSLGAISLAFQLDSVPEQSVTVSSGFPYAATTK